MEEEEREAVESRRGSEVRVSLTHPSPPALQPNRRGSEPQESPGRSSPGRPEHSGILTPWHSILPTPFTRWSDPPIPEFQHPRTLRGNGNLVDLPPMSADPREMRQQPPSPSLQQQQHHHRSSLPHRLGLPSLQQLPRVPPPAVFTFGYGQETHSRQVLVEFPLFQQPFDRTQGPVLSPVSSLTQCLAAQSIEQDALPPKRPPSRLSSARGFVSISQHDSLSSSSPSMDSDRKEDGAEPTGDKKGEEDGSDGFGTPILFPDSGERKRRSSSLADRARTASPRHTCGSSHKRVKMHSASFGPGVDHPECLDSPNYALSIIPPHMGSPAKFIHRDTLAELLRVEPSSQEPGFKKLFDHLIILDVRFPYEYHSGHIRTAINRHHWADICRLLFAEHAELPSWFQKRFPEPLEQERIRFRPGDRTCIVVHCEFSESRGPSCAEMIRSLDRKLRRKNAEIPRRLLFPQLYVLSEGYRGFYQDCPDFCVASPKVPSPAPSMVSDAPVQGRMVFDGLRQSLSKRDCSGCRPDAKYVMEKDQMYQRDASELRAEWERSRWEIGHRSSGSRPSSRPGLEIQRLPLQRSFSAQLNRRVAPRQIDLESQQLEQAFDSDELPGFLSRKPLSGRGWRHRSSRSSPGIQPSESSAFHP